jgi:negative regulator of sigma-B (phosphoserine phosphatase)
MTPTLNPGLVPQLLKWGAAGRPIAGETESGDAYTVTPFSNGVLVALVDGLGHGSEAAVAARVAVATLTQNANGAMTDLMDRCHEALRRTRGAVISIASFCADTGTMTWLGVGNVEGILFRADTTTAGARESLLLRGGVVGYQMPPLRPATLSIRPGDTLMLATDGIRGSFCDVSPLNRDPQVVADNILDKYGKKTDDALVVVVRCLNGSP